MSAPPRPLYIFDLVGALHGVGLVRAQAQASNAVGACYVGRESYARSCYEGYHGRDGKEYRSPSRLYAIPDHLAEALA